MLVWDINAHPFYIKPNFFLNYCPMDLFIMVIMKANTYRLSAKNLFLTYPNCNLSVGLALNLLKFKLSNQIIVDYLLVSEPHSDGSLHLHVYLKLSKILNTYNPAYLDINILPFRFHGNYEAAKFPNRVMEYMLKNIKDKNDPNLLFSPSLSDRIGSLGQFLSFEETILKLAREGNIQIALDMYEKERPLEFIKSHMSIERSLRQIYLKSKGFNTKFKFSDFILPDDLRVLLENFDPNKTLILIGAPGTGKTQLILAFLLHFKFRPLMINNIDSLRFFDNNKHNAIVFDDCT